MSEFQFDILYPKRNGEMRIIKAGKWFINRRTPVGEDAELIERKAFGGRKYLDIRKYKKLQ